MKCLILSCNTGEGHNSAAKAIKEYFELMGDSCDIVDSLVFLSNEASKIISKGHIFVYRNLPKLFGATYRFEENHPPKQGEDSVIYDIVSNGCYKLRKYLENNRYDAIISVHIFSSMMVTRLKKQGKINLPVYFVATDYTCSPGACECDADLYFIPHEDLTDEFVRCGLSREKLVPSGIPVSQSFYKKTPKSDAKRALKFKEDERIILLACGSMGCGPIKELCEDLPKILAENVRLVVICGNNRRLYNSLYNKGLDENVTVIGYTTRMSYYVDSADLLLIKPGGLSSTEGATKHKPLVFIDAVPGCETRNLEFFVSHGFACFAPTADELILLVNGLISSPDKLSGMSRKLADNFSKNSAKTIYEKIVNRE